MSDNIINLPAHLNGLKTVRDDKPETRSGVKFNELSIVSSVSIELANELCARGLVWLTEFGASETDLGYGGSVIAQNKEAAQEIADKRGLGEVVIGPAIEVIIT